MTRGRKPKPRLLKFAHDSSGPVDPGVPTPAPLDVAVPDELTDARARAEWQRVIAVLSPGHVTAADRAVLIGYCAKWAQWLNCEAEGARHPLIVKGADNRAMPNPAISLANRLFVNLLRAASESGFTPTSRARIAAAPFVSPNPDDEFTAWQQVRTRQQRRRPTHGPDDRPVS